MAVTVYLSSLGESGFKELAHMNLVKAHRLANAIKQQPGWSLRFESPFFREFLVRGFRGKRVLRDVVRRDVPDSLLSRQKRGFAAPVDEALQGRLGSEAARLLASDGPLQRLGAVRPEVPSRLLEEHLEGVRQHRIRLWVLLSLAAWLEAEASGG